MSNSKFHFSLRSLLLFTAGAAAVMAVLRAFGVNAVLIVSLVVGLYSPTVFILVIGSSPPLARRLLARAGRIAAVGIVVALTPCLLAIFTNRMPLSFSDEVTLGLLALSGSLLFCLIVGGGFALAAAQLVRDEAPHDAEDREV